MKPKKNRWQLIACLLITSHTAFSQWNKSAGINPSLSLNATATATSESGSKTAALAVDGDKDSRWESGNTLPSGFTSNPRQNLMHGSQPARSSGGNNLSKITDGSNSGSASIGTNTNGKSVVEIPLSTPSKVSVITLKGNVSFGTIDVTIFEPNGDSTLLGQYGGSTNYLLEKYFTTKTVSSIKLSGTSSFSVTELAAAPVDLSEDLDIDLGASKTIGWLHVRAYSSASADSVVIYGSNDQTSWTRLVKTENDNYFTAAYPIKPSVNVRYLRVCTYMKIQDYGRAQVREVSAFDEHGMYGAFPAAKPANRPLKEMVGINGIWGWGTQDYSDQAPTSKATTLYSRVATHARNYHEMEWDVADPDITPVYNGMPGSLHKTWLDWDREYQTWKNAGLIVQTSIQFTSTWLPQHLWNNPYQAAYNYGYAFASYFGPTNGNGLVTTMEVGNEPWDYDSTFYKDVLRGMASGAKAADPAMEVFSCALQSADPTTEATGNLKNYMGVRLPANTAQYLDGLNVHHYSYIADQATGQRIATYPENPASTMRGIVSDIRFRDANMPGKKIMMSEWGWDSDGAGEPCYHSECVTETAQAMYAIRGLMMMDRLGVDRATWYFYGNLPFGSSLYTRSGLTGSKNTGFTPKKSFYAVEHLLEQLGDRYFLEVIKETSDVWAYLYGDSLGNPTHIIAWKPVEASSTTTTQLEVKRGFTADSVWVYDATANTPATTTLPKNKNGEMTLDLTPAPMLIKLDSSSVATVGTREIKRFHESLDVYPNPSNGSFNAKITLNHGGEVLRKIYSLEGKVVKEFSLVRVNSGSTLLQMNVNNLSPGYYIFETATADQQFVKREKIIITP